MKQITPSLYQIALGAVNVFVIDDAGELTLIDAAFPGSRDRIFRALRQGGKDPAAIKRLILTHCHPDHAGGAAEVQEATGARVYAHEADAPLIAQGEIVGRERLLSPGLLNRVLYELFIRRASPRYAPVPVHERLRDGAVLPIAGGLEVLHTPGHSTGHIALLLPRDRVLIGGDLCANIIGLDYSTVYEDREVGRQSILKAAARGFDTAVFAHGTPLFPRADRKLHERFLVPLDTKR